MAFVDDEHRAITITNAGFSAAMVEQVVRFRALIGFAIAGAIFPILIVLLTRGGIEYLVLLVTAVAAVILLGIRTYQHQRRVLFSTFRESELRRGRCPACGYNIALGDRSRPFVTCSECGAAWNMGRPDASATP